MMRTGKIVSQGPIGELNPMTATPDRLTRPDRFPYRYTQETGGPRYWKNRAEGRSVWNNLSTFISYLRKYHNPKTIAPPEEIRYLDEQRRLLRYLASRPPPASAVRLAMVGDIMGLRLAGPSFLDRSVLEHLNGFDAVVGNLETMISQRFRIPFLLPDSITHNAKESLLTSFRRPDGSNTFTALSTANNHSLDYGDRGLSDTLDFLDRQRILHSGVRRDASEPLHVIFTAGGIRFGFVAGCWGFNNPERIKQSRLQIAVVPNLVQLGRKPVDLSAIRRALTGMAEDAVDVKIVYIHWGHEYEYYPVPELMQVGREIIRSGADLLIGSHPHLIQPLEICLLNGYEKRYRESGVDLPALHAETGCVIEDATGVPRKALIAYSMGNFSTSSYFAHTEIGMLLGLLFFKEIATGRVDWDAPRVDFIYNIHRHPVHHRPWLIMLDAFLKERATAGDNCNYLKPTIRFLRKHLFGESSNGGPHGCVLE